VVTHLRLVPRRAPKSELSRWRAERLVKACVFPAEQARIMQLLVERIDLAPDGISVTLHAAGIRSLVAELADQEAPALTASDPRWRPQSNGGARGPRGRYPDDSHPRSGCSVRVAESCS
jgi:hypothetical protein